MNVFFKWNYRSMAFLSLVMSLLSCKKPSEPEVVDVKLVKIVNEKAYLDMQMKLDNQLITSMKVEKTQLHLSVDGQLLGKADIEPTSIAAMSSQTLISHLEIDLEKLKAMSTNSEEDPKALQVNGIVSVQSLLGNKSKRIFKFTKLNLAEKGMLGKDSAFLKVGSFEFAGLGPEGVRLRIKLLPAATITSEIILYDLRYEITPKGMDVDPLVGAIDEIIITPDSHEIPLEISLPLTLMQQLKAQKNKPEMTMRIQATIVRAQQEFTIDIEKQKTLEMDAMPSPLSSPFSQ